MKSFPKKTKYKKQQRGSFSNRSSNLADINAFSCRLSLRIVESGELTSKHIDTLRKTLNKSIKKKGFFRVFVFCDIPVTKKPLEIRMGKGKGSVDHWITKLKWGSLLCYVKTSNFNLALKALRNVQYRLPLKTKII
jgi:large subunit ribosomal protein L16